MHHEPSLFLLSLWRHALDVDRGIVRGPDQTPAGAHRHTRLTQELIDAVVPAGDATAGGNVDRDSPLSMKREDRDLCSMLNLTDFHQGFALTQ